MATTPLPTALDVRELLEGLLGRDVEVTTGAAFVDAGTPAGATVAVYVDDTLHMRALAVMDVPLTCWAGAAIGLVPAGTAADQVEDGLVSETLLENATEILNVAASLFNVGDAPHLRLYRTYPPRELLANDVQASVLAYVPRLDLEVRVAGYGVGHLSVLVV